MRISDWSSDVCSSDLLTKPSGVFIATLDDGSTISAEKVIAVPGMSYFANLPGWYADVPPTLRSQIGRASCRERGCLYVLISVVAVALKKQEQQSHMM